MNWRRFKSSMGSSPEPAMPVYSSIRLLRKRPQAPRHPFARSKAKTVVLSKGGGEREIGAPMEVLKRGPSSHVPVAVLALALTNLTVDSLKVPAFFHLLAPPLHMVGLGVVFP